LSGVLFKTAALCSHQKSLKCNHSLEPIFQPIEVLCRLTMRQFGGVQVPTTGVNTTNSGASGPAKAETSVKAAVARGAYTRPTPAVAAPRMVMDMPTDAGSGLDWARKAAQAVVAHVRFMDWVDRASEKSPDGSPAASLDQNPAQNAVVSAYEEFGGPPSPGSALIAAHVPEVLVALRGTLK